MEAYTDYDFYREQYFGSSIPEQAFGSLAVRASSYVRYITFNRIEEIADDVQMATCAAAEAIYKNEQNDGKSAETIGKHSVTYNTKGTAEKKIQSAVAPYLANTGLLYRGILR